MCLNAQWTPNAYPRMQCLLSLDVRVIKFDHNSLLKHNTGTCVYAQIDAEEGGESKRVKLFLGNDCWHNFKIYFIYMKFQAVLKGFSSIYFIPCW